MTLVAALFGGCSYSAPVDRSGIESAVPLADGGVVVAFRQLTYRPATGLAAFPDGGVPHYLRDGEVIGVLSPDRPPRVVARVRNRGVPGALHVVLRGSTVDPDHLIVAESHQAPGQGASTLAWSRLNWRTQVSEPYPDFAALLGRQGREFGSPAFGDLRALDSAGALLLGARAGAVDELWLYLPGQGLRRLDTFKHFYGIAGDELYYWTGDQAVLRNWRTGALEVVANYDPATRVTTRLRMDDLAVRRLEAGAPEPARPAISDDGHAVRVTGPSGAEILLAAPADW